MTWIFLSLLCAIFRSATDGLIKKVLLEKADIYWVGWAQWTFAVPFLLPILLFTPVPTLDQTFWMSTAALLPLEISALILYIRALKLSPLSLCVPFLSFTPVFLIFTSLLLLKEVPTTRGVMGIILVTAGGYLLNGHTLSRGVFAPIRSLIRERGCLLMLMVALMYSITSTLGKVAIQHSSPLFFALFYLTILSLAMTPIAYTANRGRIPDSRSHLKYFFLIGLFYALMFFFHTLAINLAYVAYMISLKRTSMLFNIIIGHFYFNETHLKVRLLAGSIMLLGALLITL